MPEQPAILQTLRWKAACVLCEWSLVVEALVPYSPEDQRVDDTTRTALISGFWEDYCCPTHFTQARRRLHISDHGVVPETAYLYLFAEDIAAEAVPACPHCYQTMQGGQTLEKLPYYVQPALDLLDWSAEKLSKLRHLAQVEARAVQQGDTTPTEAQHLLHQELQLLQRFYHGMYTQLNVNPTAVPFLAEAPTALDAWHPRVEAMLEILQRRRSQLIQRQQTEAAKTAAVCPQCQQHSVYLLEAKTI